ncbi:MAG: histidine kinase [Crenarchaeota archaeon]|nr:MAG: histidine kinase [Thermoproteota archaeon]RDJ33801.1 MAG: histidine kinase [Thermoproteota archaeon]RDJ37089.1 MAG: histidine kinase [Thermoproteota archaeon]RDJ37376.1 MAG: histidine kinase [Thermoproteota archaeon]
MNDPDVVPEKLKSPISYKILLLIFAFGIGIYFVINTLGEENSSNLIFVLSVALAAAVSAASLTVSKRYWSTQVFGRSYLALGLGYASYAIAEVIYYTLDIILEVEAYPSVADIFFFMLYPLALIHLILNVKFFVHKFSSKQLLILGIIPIVFVISYGVISFQELEEANFDFYYGIIFIIGASLILSFAVVGATIFKQGLLGVAWLLLVVGILLNAIADVWYYVLEIFGEYFNAHPVTVVWYVSNLMMIYALYKHQKVI